VDNKEFSKEANTDYEECRELLALDTKRQGLAIFTSIGTK